MGVKFNSINATIIQKSTGTVIATCIEKNGLYQLQLNNPATIISIQEPTNTPTLPQHPNKNSQYFHDKFGHPGQTATQLLIQSGHISIGQKLLTTCTYFLRYNEEPSPTFQAFYY